MAGDAPLCNGQLYSWREVETYPRDWLREANLHTCWSLRGFPPERVTAALQRLADRHESLRTTYHLRAGKPVQQVHDAISLPVVHADRTIRSREDWHRADNEFADVAFPMTGDLGWRAAVVSSDGAPMLLSLSLSHLIVDIWSLMKLTTQFKALLADLDATAQCGPTPRELAYSPPGGHDGIDQYWRRMLDDDSMHQLPSLPAGVKRHRIQATLQSPRLGWLAAQVAKRNSVTTPAVLMALAAAGLSWYLDSDRIMISLMSSNRFSPDHQNIVGTMNQLIPVIANVDYGATFTEHIKSLHWAAARAYRYSSYDVDRVAELAADAAAQGGRNPVHDCWFNYLFRIWFNYVQFDNQPPEPSEETQAKLVWTPLARQYGQPIDFRVTAREGVTSIALRADPAIIPAEELTSILRAVAVGVHLAANEPGASLKEMRSWDISPALFPQEIPDPPN